MRLSPRWIYPRHNVALSNAQMGDYAAAEAAYLEARKLSPRAYFLAYNLGMLYQQLNRLKDAERLLNEAAALEPSRPEALNGLGLVFAAAGKINPAEAKYKAALALDSAFGPARHNLALLLWGSAKRRTEALTIWRQLVTDQPGLAAARAALADALLEQGDADGARSQYAYLLKERPGSLSARLALAECHLRARAWADAEAVLVVGGAQHPAVEEKLADVRAAAGRIGEARAAYVSLEAKSPDPGARRRLQTKIKVLRGAA